MSDKKIFFCGRGPCEEPGAWAKLVDEAWVRDFMKENLAEAGVTPEVSFNRLRIESHHGLDQADTRVYIWGEDEPGFDANDYGDHEGLIVQIDGREVYRNLRFAGDASELESHREDDPECGCEDPKDDE